MIHYFADLRSDELEMLPPELTVFLFSLGGFEQHGSHLPLGTKWIQAEQGVRLLAESLQSKMPQWNFVLMPTLPLTVDTITSKISFPVRAHVVRDYLVDQGRGLKRLKFSMFAVYSSHLTPRQLSAIEEAAKMVSRRDGIFWGQKARMISISSNEIASGEIMKSPMIANPKEHGGAKDTGLMLAFRQNKVSPDYVTLKDLPAQKENAARLIAYFRHEIGSYWGKPREANAEMARRSLQEKCEKTAVMLQAVFESGGQGGSLFNSGYRYFFFNGSFFKAYFFAAIFFVMMMFWTLWSLKDVFEP